MRLDKFLSEKNVGTRSVLKEYIKKGRVTVNGTVAKAADMKIDENNDSITFDGIELFYEKFVYYMLNKPAGVVSATNDNTCTTMMDLLDVENKDTLFSIGRLDKDTEGLLLITNDGDLCHRLLSPKKHVPKTYFVRVENPLSKEDIIVLEKGVDIGEERETLPAKIEILNELEFYLTITEGKFHQVKRMMQAVDNEVIYLQRISMGGLKLDENLPLGEYRKLTGSEIDLLNKR